MHEQKALRFCRGTTFDHSRPVAMTPSSSIPCCYGGSSDPTKWIWTGQADCVGKVQEAHKLGVNPTNAVKINWTPEVITSQYLNGKCIVIF